MISDQDLPFQISRIVFELTLYFLANSMLGKVVRSKDRKVFLNSYISRTFSLERTDLGRFLECLDVSAVGLAGDELSVELIRISSQVTSKAPGACFLFRPSLLIRKIETCA